MSRPEKITGHLEYLYGEDLVKNGKPTRVTVTIKDILDDEFTDTRGGKTKGIAIAFEETARKLGITGVEITRQLHQAIGSEMTKDAIGKKIVLYAKESRKAGCGWAVRIATAVDK